MAPFSFMVCPYCLMFKNIIMITRKRRGETEDDRDFHWQCVLSLYFSSIISLIEFSIFTGSRCRRKLCVSKRCCLQETWCFITSIPYPLCNRRWGYVRTHNCWTWRCRSIHGCRLVIRLNCIADMTFLHWIQIITSQAVFWAICWGFQASYSCWKGM